MEFSEEEFMACCGSSRFAQEMVKFGPLSSLEEAIHVARDVWFNTVDVHGCLQAFSAHPQIGNSPSPSSHPKFAQWSKGEQSTALATATSSGLQELSEWNLRYNQKFGFVFLICASGRSTDEILSELKKRYPNRPIVELEIAAREQMKITELRLAKLFSTKEKVSSVSNQYPESLAKKAEEDRVTVIGGHVTASASESSAGKIYQSPNRTRPPITTHVLDVSRGSPGRGIEVRLDMWNGPNLSPLFGDSDTNSWVFQGSSVTDNDGRSGPLMSIVEAVKPGTYRLSFNTGKYFPEGFFPYVSLVFAIRESQKLEHFHVPLLLSPFSFTTYRGS